MCNNKNLIHLGYNLALKSPVCNKYAAFLIHRGKIVSSGYNYFTRITGELKSCIL